ncbi:MAG: flagellar assembly protein FliW [bacterium]|nr:flagellar assembly protein FliW [bacterium]
MKKIKTKPFGEIELDETQEIYFPDGLFGFELCKKFYILENPDSPFVWLQSSEEPALAFVMIHPMQFKTNYELKVSDEDLKSIEIASKNDILDFVIVTIPEEPSLMTANLQGPIIINIKKKLGKQAISLKDDYTVKCNILEEMKKLAAQIPAAKKGK